MQITGGEHTIHDDFLMKMDDNAMAMTLFVFLLGRQIILYPKQLKLLQTFCYNNKVVYPDRLVATMI